MGTPLHLKTPMHLFIRFSIFWTLFAFMTCSFVVIRYVEQVLSLAIAKEAQIISNDLKDNNKKSDSFIFKLKAFLVLHLMITKIIFVTLFFSVEGYIFWLSFYTFYSFVSMKL